MALKYLCFVSFIMCNQYVFSPVAGILLKSAHKENLVYHETDCKE